MSEIQIFCPHPACSTTERKPSYTSSIELQRHLNDAHQPFASQYNLNAGSVEDVDRCFVHLAHHHIHQDYRRGLASGEDYTNTKADSISHLRAGQHADSIQLTAWHRAGCAQDETTNHRSNRRAERAFDQFLDSTDNLRRAAEHAAPDNVPEAETLLMAVEKQEVDHSIISMLPKTGKPLRKQLKKVLSVPPVSREVSIEPSTPDQAAATLATPQRRRRESVDDGSAEGQLPAKRRCMPSRKVLENERQMAGM